MTKPPFTVDPPPVDGGTDALRAWLYEQLVRVEVRWPRDSDGRLTALEKRVSNTSGGVEFGAKGIFQAFATATKSSSDFLGAGTDLEAQQIINLDYSSDANAIYISVGAQYEANCRTIFKLDVSADTLTLNKSYGQTLASQLITINGSDYLFYSTRKLSNEYWIFNQRTSDDVITHSEDVTDRFWSFVQTPIIAETDGYVYVKRAITGMHKLDKSNLAGSGTYIPTPASRVFEARSNYAHQVGATSSLHMLTNSTDTYTNYVYKYDETTGWSFVHTISGTRLLLGRPVEYNDKVYWPTTSNSVTPWVSSPCYLYVTDKNGVFVEEIPMFGGGNMDLEPSFTQTGNINNGRSPLGLDSTNGVLYYAQGGAEPYKLWSYNIASGVESSLTVDKPASWTLPTEYSQSVIYVNGFVYMFEPSAYYDSGADVYYIGVLKIEV